MDQNEGERKKIANRHTRVRKQKLRAGYAPMTPILYNIMLIKLYQFRLI